MALAEPNGAGKTTFYHAHLQPAGLRFVNADVLANLRAAVRELPHVLIFDHDDLRTPFRLVAVFQKGHCMSLNPPPPKWLKPLLP